MARPETLRGTKLRLRFGNGGTPEIFTAPCGLTSKEIKFTTNLNEFEVPDCADEDLPAWVERAKSARTASISGSGIMAKESYQTYLDAWKSNDPRNMEIVLDFPVSPVTWTGAWHVSELTFKGENSGLVEVEVSIESHGEILGL